MTSLRLRRARGVAVSLLAPGLLVGCAVLAPTGDPAPVVRGPLPSRVQHPVALTFLSPRPRRAATQPRGTWGLAADATYSSLFEEGVRGADRVVFDGEVLRSSARARYGLGGGLDIEVELAVVYAGGGFLDSFVDSFHSSTGFPGGGRGSVPKDRFEMSIVNDGTLAYRLAEDEVGLADLPITLTGALRREDESGPGLAWRAALELPTGSESKGFGSGGVDFGVGLLIERSLQRWSLFGALDYVAVQTPEGFARAGIDADDLFQLQGGAEFRWNDRLSLLGQVVATTPLTRDVDLEEIDEVIVDVAIGAAYDFPGGPRISAAFHEDVVAATGPDFSAFLGLSWGF